MKRVITSSDSNLDYAFFIPIIYFFWKNLDYKLNLFLTGNLKEWGQDKQSFVFSKIEELDIAYNFLPASSFNLEPWALAPFSRLYGCLFVDHKEYIKNEDYILTTDIDMLPIDSSWFTNHSEDTINIFGEDGDTGGYGHSRYPICYIGCTSHNWKNLLRINKDDNLIKTINEHYNLVPQNLSEGQKRSLDEVFFHSIYNNKKYFNIDTRFIFRKMIPNPAFKGHDNKTPFILPEKRIDRSNWDLSILPNAIDAHCPRPGYTDENWVKILPILEKCLNNEQLKYIKNYREEFIKWISA